MNEPSYNSLTEMLKESGILPSEKRNSEENLFGIVPDLDMSHSPFLPQNEQIKSENPIAENKKRLNSLEIDLIGKKAVKEDETTNILTHFKIIERFLSFKQNYAKNKKAIFDLERLFFTFCPKIYKAKLAKDALSKLVELNIDTKILSDKTIPYGESENRYEDLIKYLNYANKLQVKLKKKI